MTRVACKQQLDACCSYIALLNFYPMKIALTVGPYIPLVAPAADDYDVAAKLRCVCVCLCVCVRARAALLQAGVQKQSL